MVRAYREGTAWSVDIKGRTKNHGAQTATVLLWEGIYTKTKKTTILIFIFILFILFNLFKLFILFSVHHLVQERPNKIIIFYSLFVRARGKFA